MHDKKSNSLSSILQHFKVITFLVQKCTVALKLCTIQIMITIYRRVVPAIAVDHSNSWSRSFTEVGKLYGCNIMRPGVCRNPGNVMPAFTTYSHVQQENEGWHKWGEGQKRREQHKCHSLVKALQCWWAPAAVSLSALARWHQLSDYTHSRYYQ